MSRFELLATVPVQDTLGECIVWDEQAQRVWWTDIQGRRLHRFSPTDAALETFDLPERLGSFGFVAGTAELICAFASGFALYDVASEALTWLYRPELGWQGTRFNDGRVDRQGRFWSGTMVKAAATDQAGQAVKGSLYVVGGGAPRRVLGEIAISNSLCWNLDGTTLYFADSPTRQIVAYVLNPRTAALGAKRVFAKVESGGVPDGSVVDADGFLWNAEWGGSRLVRYAPSGDVDCILGLPVTQPTCLCFGGAALDCIFVSTATEGLDPETLSRQPEAGNVLIYRTPFKGVPENRFLP